MADEVSFSVFLLFLQSAVSGLHLLVEKDF